MAQSMTGFASQTTTLGEWKLSFECKSVNSRFLDITLKLPDVVKVIPFKQGGCNELRFSH